MPRLTPRPSCRATFLIAGTILGLGQAIHPATGEPSEVEPTPRLPPARWEDGVPKAPPANPPAGQRPRPPATVRLQFASPAVYSIGEPTDEEQLYVEFINRARGDPMGEAERLASTTDADILRAYSSFGVDLDQMRSQFAAISPQAPVSINARLTEAARRHSADMLQNAFQGHNGSEGSTPPQRIEDAGYDWSAYGENVYASAVSVPYGHAGFEVDWGPGPGGMQDPPGHRESIHSPLFREIGVGVVEGTNGSVGPQIVTQDFADGRGTTPFVTGVVYYDLNGNQFYDPGEGIGGTAIRVSGTTTTGRSARSGGYSVPLPGNGNYTVSFEVPGLEPVDRDITIAGRRNVKADDVPVYSAPVVGGSTVAFVDHDNAYVFSPVGGATGYEWSAAVRQTWNLPEGAEQGLDGFAADTTPGYEVVSTRVAHSGSRSFRLAHGSPAADQFLTFHDAVLLGVASELVFWGRLGAAGETEIARVQISSSDGKDWTELWSQAGNGNPGESGFTEHRLPLTDYAGEIVRFRFAYTLEPGNYFLPTADHVGWYIDDVQMTDAEALVEGPVQEALADHNLQFHPTLAGSYVLRVRARIGDRVLPWGPGIGITAETGTPPIADVRIDSFDPAPGGGWDLVFHADSGSGTSVAVEEATQPTGPWSQASDAIIESGANSGEFRGHLPTRPAPARFFRVSVAP